VFVGHAPMALDIPKQFMTYGYRQFRKKANFRVALHLEVAAAYISTPHSPRFARLELDLFTKLSRF